jgi:SAM-dependent methyltransferase
MPLSAELDPPTQPVRTASDDPTTGPGVNRAAPGESASRFNCRFCAMPLSRVVADLGMQPLSNGFLTPAQALGTESFHPLRALVCDGCGLVQAQQVESAEHIFTAEYPYFSSTSEPWLAHARRYADEVSARFGLDARHRVVEIACNDGYLLRWFSEKGIQVLGVEPTASTARAAESLGIPVRQVFFGAATARQMREQGLLADLMPANNVVAHIPDLHDFIEGFEILLAPGGVATFEFHHVLNLLRQQQFDTIYHEHFYYHSLTTFEKILAAHRLEVFDVEELPTHGGSLRVYAQRQAEGRHRVSPAVAALRERERAAGLLDPATYATYDEACRRMKRQMLAFLIDAKNQGRSIAACGAAAKGNTLLNYGGVRTDFIDYVVDDTPWKQGRLLPGTHIPVVAADRLIQTRPDYLVILPWNWRDELMRRFAVIRQWGGRFVVLTPEVQVL